jgi:NitT/TauT family transport system permease protein
MKTNSIQERLFPLLCPAVLLLLWEIVGRCRFALKPLLVFLGFSELSIPDFSFLLPVSAVAPCLWRLFASGEVLQYLWDTTWRSCVGFSVAAFVGIALGIPLGLSRRVERLFLPSVDAMRTLPPISLLPVLILFFGIDNAMKIVFIFIGGVWPVLMNTAQSVKSVDPMYLKVAFNAGHSSAAILRRVIFPASLPGIFTGLKVSLSICVILSIVCEMLAGNTGLGFFLNYTKRNLEYDKMFAALFVVALLGWVLNALINHADRWLLSWFYRSRETQMEYHHPWKF